MDELKNKETKPRIYETLSGNKMLPTFDPQLIAGFHDIWNDFEKSRGYDPINKADMHLDKDFDFFAELVTRVKKYNESYDMTLVGDRGLGKSASGLAAAIEMHRSFVGDPDAVFPISHVCFDVKSWMALVDTMPEGGVIVLDEVGTEGSLSSRTSMSKDNRATSDVIQLVRTARIITIYISVDSGRIDKRVRQLTRVLGSPIEKLSNADTNGYGLGIECDFKLRRTKPGRNTSQKGRDDDSGYLQHIVSAVHFSQKGEIMSFVLPHPPIELWAKYEDVRDAKLTEVRERALGEYSEDVEEIEEREVPKKIGVPKHVEVPKIVEVPKKDPVEDDFDYFTEGY
jgi:hypothetical protein